MIQKYVACVQIREICKFVKFAIATKNQQP